MGEHRRKGSSSVFNDQSFSFRHQIIGIKSDNTELLNVIIKELKDNNDFIDFICM